MGRPLVRSRWTVPVPADPQDRGAITTDEPELSIDDLAPTDFSGARPPAKLYIEDPRAPSNWRAGGIVTWKQIEEPIDGEDFVCTIGADSLDIENLFESDGLTLKQHFASLIEELRGDRLVRVVAPMGPVGDQVLFEGYPLTVTLNWTEKQQSLTAHCLLAGQERLRTGLRQQIAGRYMRRTPDLDWDQGHPDHKLVTALVPVFNAGGRPNRTATPYNFDVFGGTTSSSQGSWRWQPFHLWTTDDHPDAEYWTFAQALRALVYFWVVQGGKPVDVYRFLADTTELVSQDPAADSEDPLIARITQRVNDVSLQGFNVDEALAALCEAAGLHYQIAIEASAPSTATGAVGARQYLRIWAARRSEADDMPDQRYMGVPQLHDIPRERPFSVDPSSTMSASGIARANAAQQGTLTFDRRGVTDLEVYGGYDEVELSLMMRPGWPPDNANLDDVSDVDASYSYWMGQFGTEYEPHAKIPKSVYHGAHPDHAPVAEYFRRWIFPDELTEAEALALGRSTGAFTVDRYRIRRADDDKLQWSDWDWGGGLLPTRTQDWVPWRRQILDTIARRNTGSTDVGPIVRVHFGLGKVHLDEDFTVAIDAVTYEIDDVSYSLAATTHECTASATTYLWADISQSLKTSTSGWPSTEDDHYRLATVYCNADGVRAIVPYAYQTTPPDPHDPGWVEFTGQVRFDTDRIGIWFVDANFFNAIGFREDPANQFGSSTKGLALTNYLNGHFWVQLTCTVRGDQRLYTAAGAGANGLTSPVGDRSRHQIRDTGFERFQRRLTSGDSAGNSYLATLDHAEDDEAQFANRDDRDDLAWYAQRRLRQLCRTTIAGDLELFFLSRKYRPGDAFSGCDGLGLHFDHYPQVERVQFINSGGGQRTRLLLSDTRTDPSAGVEG